MAWGDIMTLLATQLVCLGGHLQLLVLNRHSSSPTFHAIISLPAAATNFAKCTGLPEKEEKLPFTAFSLHQPL